MLKVRRIHIVNAGYEEATFDGETFDFRDPDGGGPAHAVLHAENGTGKTTALGLIFNTAVPKESRFLPHLVKPDYQFADYFPRGVGAVAVEWHDAEGRHPVTLHLVVPQLRGGDRQTWRRWALFRSGPGLGFDDLPLKGLDGRARTAFTGRDDVAAWLSDHQARFADSHDFETATTQEAWRAVLERFGIDTQLMDSQLEFNRQEGGLDAFLKIPGEEEFIARFLALCLVGPERAGGGAGSGLAEPVCAQVRAIVARMQGYDTLIAKRGLLTDLTRAFQPFAGTALRWRDQRLDTLRAESHAAALRRAAGRRADRLDAQAANATAEAEAQIRRRDALAGEARLAGIAADAARLILADVRAGAAAEARERTVDEGIAAERQRTRLAAARDLRDVLATEAEIAGYAAALAEARAAAVGPSRHAAQAGATLAAMLERAAAERRAAQTDALAAAAEAERNRDRARKRRTVLAAEETTLQREDAALVEKIAAAERALDQLAGDGFLRPSEGVPAALARLAAERDEAAGAARDADTRARRHETAAEEAGRRAAEADAARREALARAEAERRVLERAERARAELAGGPSWHEHLGPGVGFGPAAAVAAQDRARDRAEEARRRTAEAERMRRDADRIARHRVAAVDANVELVLERLEAAGLRSAIAAASWLAEVVGDASVLRAYAATDPAAFAGVFVQDPAELARVPALSFDGLPLDRPVAVLPPADRPGASGEARTAIIPDRAEAYEIAAAEALVASLGARVGEAEAAADRAAAAADALAALKAAVEGWLADWGGGRLEAGRQAVAGFEAAAETARAEGEAARALAEAERRAAAQARQEARSYAETSAACARALAAVERWQRTQGEPLSGWRVRSGQIDARLTALADEMALEEAAADAARERAEEARHAAQAAERTLADFAAEAARIEHRNAPAPDLVPSLDDARAAYATAAEVLRRLLEDRLGPIQGSLDRMRRELEQRLDRLRRDHGAVAEERDALAPDARDPALEERLAAARHAAGAAREAVGRAKGEAERLDAEARRLRAAFLRHGAAGQEALDALEPPADRDPYALSQLAEDADERRRAAEALAVVAGEAIEAARARAVRAVAEAARLRDRAQPLPDAPAPGLDLPDSLGEALAALDAGRKRLEAAAAALRRHELALAEAYDGFRRDARGHRDRPLEAVLIDTLVANEPEPAAEDVERLQTLLAHRIETVQQDIDRHESDKNHAVGEMDGLLLAAVGLFQRAVNRGVVPDGVPRFGGKRILTMAFRPPSASGEAGVALRRNLCERALVDFVASGEVPRTDHAMAALLLERFARTVHLRRPEEPALGLRLLKSNDQGRIHHLPVAAFKASGGETLTSAMLLYLLVARLRSEGRASQRARIGGVLILDNPLGKASNSLFLKMQLALAAAVDVQLIFTTAIKDWAAVGEFPQVIKLRKETTDPATGRIFVKATRQWIGRPDAATGKVPEAAKGFEEAAAEGADWP
ncbi:hypothetical protein [Azospirillum canadense]|uniref:hypothetical protein n=1 Tax=Azospirillum canadense TaxID=403962 RepID=UPI002227469E|nr:hypothetical protein [Azospirillum canadense]MCW2241763.1 hypothetical protein [Azospirillum canadense]